MMEQENRSDHLLDYLAEQVGCLYLSNLHNPTGEIRDKLEAVMAGFPAKEATLREWNAALDYLHNAPPVRTAIRDRAQLLALLQK